jgi:hypothetical protein
MMEIIKTIGKDAMMLDELFRMTDFELFCLIGTIFILGSIACVIIIRRLIPIEMRYKDNPVIGNVGSLISLIYGVLVGITALYLINNLSATQDAVQHEANASANIYRDSKLLKEPNRSKIENDVKQYLHEVINMEWPTMQAGQTIDFKGNYIIEDISNVLLNYNSGAYTNGELLVLRDMIDENKSLYNARQTRIVESQSELSVELWQVILVGTVLVLGINFVFGVHLYFHLFAVDPGPFDSVLKFITDEETHPWRINDAGKEVNNNVPTS